MATMRIRSLKPEFFDSPSTAAAGPWARLLFMGMWCMADDWGVGPANPKELAASIFPNDDQWTSKELPSLCKEVADSYGVVFYTHRGRPYFQIPTWEDHQITQRRAKRRYPTADDPESVLDQASPELPSIRKEVPCEDKEKSSSEQGNRGSGEQGSRGTSAARKTTPKPKPVEPDTFPDWYQAYPRHEGRAKAVEAYIKALSTVDADTLHQAAVHTAAYHAREQTPAKYIPLPATWLNQGRWTDDSAKAPAPQARPKPEWLKYA